MPKITPFLWFDTQAEEAMNFYVSIFKNAKALGVTRYGDSGPGPKGSVMTAAFELEGQRITALNGGPHFKLSPAFSFVVSCQTQEEIDEYWEKLSAGGKMDRCGWLTDKFGVSWQVVPAFLQDLTRDNNPAKTSRMMQALLQMDKLDIARLKQAYEQG